MSKIRRDFYKSDDYTGKIPWKLKIGRDHLPAAIEKAKLQTLSKDLVEWINNAQHWIDHRSSGYNGGTKLTKDEIKLRKKELGHLLTLYNRYFANNELISF